MCVYVCLLPRRRHSSLGYFWSCWGWTSAVLTLGQDPHEDLLVLGLLGWWSSGWESAFQCRGPGSILGLITKTSQAAAQLNLHVATKNLHAGNTESRCLRAPALPQKKRRNLGKPAHHNKYPEQPKKKKKGLYVPTCWNFLYHLGCYKCWKKKPNVFNRSAQQH